MKKRLFSLLLAAAVLLALTLPAAAARPQYVADDSGFLTQSELEDLNRLAAAVSDKCGADVGFVFSAGCGGEDVGVFAEETYQSGGFRSDCLLFVVDTDTLDCGFVTEGSAAAVTEADENALIDDYNAETTYYDGVEAYLNGAAALLAGYGVQTDAPDAGVSAIPAERQLPRLVDNAGLLTADEAAALNQKLDEISERQQFDVAVVTVTDLEGKDISLYAADFYDYNGYGYGENNDGALLLVMISGSDRQRFLVTTGYGVTALTDAGIGYVLDKTRSDMSDGKYAAAFDQYADLCDKFVTQARTGTPYDTGHMPKGSFPAFGNLALALLIGAGLALLIVFIEQRKCRNVRAQTGAADYRRPGSMVITGGGDIFLSRRVTRVEKPKPSSGGGGGGGSSTYHGSSGVTHGGGGDRF